MISPYFGKFTITQVYKQYKHEGLDLVGIDTKDIHSVSDGVVIHASKDSRWGFGLYVAVEIENGDVWYYGHLSEICVKVGDKVKMGDLLGVEGNTGNSRGSHLHICYRVGGEMWKDKDCSKLLGIPNTVIEDKYYEYKPKKSRKKKE